MTIEGHSYRAELDATRYTIFLGAQRGAHHSDSTEFLGKPMFTPRQPGSSGKAKTTPDDCVFRAELDCPT